MGDNYILRGVLAAEEKADGDEAEEPLKPVRYRFM
jgi:hypothetical protein